MAHLQRPGRQTRERTVPDGLGRREPCRAHERCSPMSHARYQHRNNKLRDCRPSRDAARHPLLGQGGTGQDAHRRRAIVGSCCAGRGTVRGISLGCDVLTLDFNKKLGVPMGAMAVGSAEVIRHLLRIQESGGGMRAAGVLAAAARQAVSENLRARAGGHARGAETKSCATEEGS